MDTPLCIGRYERAFAEYLGGSRVRYTWKCGHSYNETLMIGPKGRGSRGQRKPIAPDMVRLLARYWGRRGDDGAPIYTLAAGPCPRCVKLAKQRDPRLVQHLKPRRG